MPPLLYYDPPAPTATEYRVGLCAWQDKSMIEEGRFYPIKSMKAEERLWWYSRFFDCVEVNSTFYAPLSVQNAVLWVKRTPPGFLFSVKAYALLTAHHLDAARLPEPLAEMLPAGGRPNARGQIDNDAFPPEARDWAFAAFREALQFLARHGLTYVSVDTPRTPANVASAVALTSPVAVYRLHGRNAEGFLKQLRGKAPSVAEKYGYLYNQAELTKIVDRGRELEGHARRIYFKLNNNVGDAPAINGVQIRELLGQDNADRDQVETEWRQRRRRPRAP